MREVVEEVNNSQERSKETVQAFQTMREGIDQTTEGTDQIEELNRRQAEQLELLRGKLDRLFRVLEESLRKSESTTLVAEDMYESSEELNTTLEKFTIDSITRLKREQGDLRTHPRIKNHLQVDILYRGETIEAMSNDISLRGMNLKSKHRLKGEQELQGLLHLPVNPGEVDQVIPLRMHLLRERKSGKYYIYGAEIELANKADDERLKKAFAFFQKPHAYEEGNE
jgi:methyl-accepting chemotaxis protein